MDNRDELRDELEEYLNGLWISDYITRKEQKEVLKDFDKWLKTAKIGDTYDYDGMDYTIESIEEED